MYMISLCILRLSSNSLCSLRLLLISLSFFLSLPNAGITNVNHQTQLIFQLSSDRIKSKFSYIITKMLPVSHLVCIFEIDSYLLLTHSTSTVLPWCWQVYSWAGDLSTLLLPEVTFHEATLQTSSLTTTLCPILKFPIILTSYTYSLISCTSFSACSLSLGSPVDKECKKCVMERNTVKSWLLGMAWISYSGMHRSSDFLQKTYRNQGSQNSIMDQGRISWSHTTC